VTFVALHPGAVNTAIFDARDKTLSRQLISWMMKFVIIFAKVGHTGTIVSNLLKL
jgi:hypothetical protein